MVPDEQTGDDRMSLNETMVAIRGASADADPAKLARVSREMGMSTILHLALLAESVKNESLKIPGQYR